MFLVSEATITGKSAWDIGQELMRWLQEKGVNEIISMEGFPFANPSDSIFGFTTGDKNLLEYNVQPIDQGAVSGINASLLENAIKKDIPWTTIFIPTRIVSGIDYKATISAIQVLGNMFNIDINTEQLEKLSDAITAAAKNRQQRQEKKGSFLDRILPGQNL
jgi:predicted ATP-grasp superfamily ATP-dependent carboligase